MSRVTTAKRDGLMRVCELCVSASSDTQANISCVYMCACVCMCVHVCERTCVQCVQCECGRDSVMAESKARTEGHHAPRNRFDAAPEIPE